MWLTLCILAYRLFATTCKHPCLKPLGVHFRHLCLFMNALLALRPCKAFGRSFQASLPCSLLPLHRILTFPQPLQKDNNPSLSTTSLPPLSKGGGLTARHKLLSCCVLIATHLPFYSLNFSAVKTEGLLYHPSPRTIPPTFRRARVCVCLYSFVFALSPSLFVGERACVKSNMVYTLCKHMVYMLSITNEHKNELEMRAKPEWKVHFLCFASAKRGSFSIR